MAKKKKRKGVPKKFAGKLPVWLTDKPLHDLAKEHARAEKRSLSALTEQALRNYLARMAVLDAIDKNMPGNEKLTLDARQKIAGTDTTIHRSFVVDQPGCPVAAPCVLEGCRYADLDDLAESFAGGDKAVVAAAMRLVQSRLPRHTLVEAAEISAENRQASRDEIAYAASLVLRDTGLSVSERRKAAKEVVKASAKRVLKKHAKAFERLSSKEVAKALGAEPCVNVQRAAHKGGFIEAGALATIVDTGKSVLPAGKQCCRRSECRHAKARHSPTKSGQLRCDVAGCNCARYMD